MKTTMKNHGYHNKIRSIRKIAMQLIMAALILAFASCEKEEIFEPDQEVHEVDKSTKATARIVPDQSLEIQLKRNNAPYDIIRENRTVRFKNRFWSSQPKATPKGTITRIWSSPNGLDWTVSNDAPFTMVADKMVVHNNKMWVIGLQNNSREFHIYSSRDGLLWDRVRSILPISSSSRIDAVVFKNKIFIFEAHWRENVTKVWSSSNGIRWALESSNAFPKKWNGTPLVFKDNLYHIGGSLYSNDTFKSANGQDWSRVRTLRPLDSATEDFPKKSHHAAVVHDNKVWVTGGGSTHQGKEIWYSGDMKNWTKFTGPIPFDAYAGPTMLSYKNEILLLGGYHVTAAGVPVYSKSIWSIKSKIKGHVTIDIKKEYPTIPSF